MGNFYAVDKIFLFTSASDISRSALRVAMTVYSRLAGLTPHLMSPKRSKKEWMTQAWRWWWCYFPLQYFCLVVNNRWAAVHLSWPRGRKEIRRIKFLPLVIIIIRRHAFVQITTTPRTLSDSCYIKSFKSTRTFHRVPSPHLLFVLGPGCFLHFYSSEDPLSARSNPALSLPISLLLRQNK